MRIAVWGGATCSVKATITPVMSFIRSHRETCTTSGTSGAGGGPLCSTSACRSTRPGEPSRRQNAPTGAGSGGPTSRPACTSACRTICGSTSRLFGENGSSERADGDDLLRGYPIRGERAAGEHQRVGRLQVGPQERPARRGVLVAPIGTDMAAPRHQPAGPPVAPSGPGRCPGSPHRYTAVSAAPEHHVPLLTGGVGRTPDGQQGGGAVAAHPTEQQMRRVRSGRNSSQGRVAPLDRPPRPLPAADTQPCKESHP